MMFCFLFKRLKSSNKKKQAAVVAASVMTLSLVSDFDMNNQLH